VEQPDGLNLSLALLLGLRGTYSDTPLARFDHVLPDDPAA
jgi:hypothetical protein